jgi:predicted homoserine dehydrogenase-like protein
MRTMVEQLAARADSGRPVRVALVGAGKFGTMFLSQARRLRGLHVAAVVDRSVHRARAALVEASWPPEQFAAASVAEALRAGSTYVGADVDEAFARGELEVVVEATGSPTAAVAHAQKAFAHGCHLVMATAEADALLGPLLARQAEDADVVYTMAYGDQPALICELVGWAHACGFDVVCAGKGTKYLPDYRFSTPETVWENYGIDAHAAAKGKLNPQMFNSFLDGTKSAIEMACVANATGLRPQATGLSFPPCGAGALAQVLRPYSAGGTLPRGGTVEVVSSLERDGSAVANDLRWGVYVTFEAPNEFVRRSFSEYGLATDDSGWFAALYRPYHLIGLEVSVSVLTAALRGEATGAARGYVADVVATAKRDLEVGDELDGEGGHTVYGTLADAESATTLETLPIGLASNIRIRRPVARESILRFADVELAADDPIVALRREQDALLRPGPLEALD